MEDNKDKKPTENLGKKLDNFLTNTKTQSKECEGDECLINDGKEIVEIVRTNCGHVFHSKCLAKWVPHNTTCPMCRQSITKK